MALPTLYVTRLLPSPIMATLRERYRLVAEPAEDAIPTAEDLRAGFAESDAVICMLSDSIDADLLGHATKLKILANYAVGYNNIDLAAAKARGIVVTNTPDVLTDATADLAWALMMAVARRVVEGDQWVRTGTWLGWAPTQLLGADVTGKTLGIIGMGRIGQAVAQRAQGFRMRVLYESRRTVAPPPGLSWERRPLDEVLTEADFVSLHVPLTEATRHLIGARELSLMKPTAVLINTARGPVVDEEALVSALKAGTIAGAGLDVYEQEPLVHPGLVELPNVVLLPHLGSATLETRIRMGRICLDNIEAVLNGRLAPNRIF
ncbi:2-hydroxyacid dehydrogenase [Candidatus Nitrospira inopinata]|jgi:glyoxylate reductase|uniref:2-oxo-carboxylic acid reductase (Glyoxalate reductase) (2-ketoaldonate reductase) n=1 Tax=Candidatus Nitrospira inopinata TaxID=1715989 RepID=A0A0S4KWE3_9BACT|nr:D-glycerate dehydrogenase [Candidatus Nitrospira inopinata]CUQ67544.1 2-oxo-carboxylic acid reductase (glyoxalate reductase) (2-ketoaldonate reductase) [Candidatus Nitrospira inopinata]